jgi:NAD(P)H-dependent FMN reductase
MFKLMIISASTRNERKGPVFADWIESLARKDADWDIDAVDLKTLDLPLLDEPMHPRLKNYQYDHTKAWSAKVEAADAFIVVVPEYNFGPSPALINAIDYLFSEWAYKPMGFVSYGGASAGTRGVQMLKQIVTTLKIVPITEAVSVPFFPQFIDADGKLTSNQQMEAGAAGLFAELKKWAGPLRAMRAPAA